MKKTISLLLFIALCNAAFSQELKSIDQHQLEGSWYGLFYGSQVCVSFNTDKTYSIQVEAFSQMNMSGKYSLDENTLSLDGIPGMEGKGLVSIDKGKMNLLMIFGSKGNVQAPESFNDGAGNPAAMRFELNADSSIIAKALAKVNAPESAKLAFERNNILGKGINLNSVLDGLSGDRPLQPGAIADIARQGFKSVRIPIRFSDHTTKTSPFTIDPDFIKKVDTIVDECLAEGLAVTLDNHYYPGISFGFQAEDLSYEDNIKRLYCIWEQLSAHYKDYPDNSVFFELMNEPGLKLDPALWNDIVKNCVNIIRKENPAKTIIVTTASLGQHWTVGLLEFPPDEWNIIVDAHYYLPHTFTHQGLSYAMAEGSLGMKWSGSDYEKSQIIKDMDFLARWSERTARPVNIGEYGVCANADDASRNAYLCFICDEMTRRGFSSNIWAYHRDIFGIYDEKSLKWNAGLLKALKLETKDNAPGTFRNPDLSFAPYVRWWWPGNDVETDELKRQMRLFADHHIGGVEIQPFALVLPPPMDRISRIMSFDTDSYYANLKTVMESAKALGMTVDLSNGSGWPASGSHISEAEENRSLQYGMTEIPLEGGSVDIPRPQRQDSEYATLAGLLEALISEPDEKGSRKIKDVKIVNNTKFKASKDVSGYKRVLIALWNVPSKETNLLVAKPNAGNVLDHFNTQVLRKNYDHYFGPSTGLDNYYGKPFRSFFNDSYEFKVDRHFTDDFIEVFRTRRGYDPLPWLPANIWYGYNNMYDNSHSAPEFTFGDIDWRLRYDYDLTVSDLVRKHLIRGSSEWAHEKGLQHRTQAYGIPIDYMGATADADIPEAENMIFGQGSEGGLKMVSSGAMLYNKTLVSAESGVHIGRGLMATPQKLRSIADKLLYSGVNQIIWHGTPYRYEVNGRAWLPFYNTQYGINFSSELFEENVFWDEFKQVNIYVQRAQSLMQKGHAEADVLVYYPFLEYSGEVQNPEEILCNGIMPESDPDKPRIYVPQDSCGKWLYAIFPILNELERKGLTWAWVNDESLQQMTTSDDGQLQIRGNNYSGLLLYNLPWIQLETARNLSRQKNANILIIGDLPAIQPSFMNYKRNDRRTAKLMAETASHKNVCNTLADWNLKSDATTVSGGERVRISRRRMDNGFVQMYWNVNDNWQSITIKSDAPYTYWMDADDGSIIEASRNDDGNLECSLAPLSTLFLFASDTPISEAFSKQREYLPKIVATPEFTGLQPGDWRDDPSLERSAEKTTYTAFFTLEKKESDYYLDLGNVYYSAEVIMNGNPAGKRCWKPFLFNVTDLVRDGFNKMEIRITPTDYNARTTGSEMANGLEGKVAVLEIQQTKIIESK